VKGWGGGGGVLGEGGAPVVIHNVLSAWQLTAIHTHDCSYCRFDCEKDRVVLRTL
jgi:hypothetical protein